MRRVPWLSAVLLLCLLPESGLAEPEYLPPDVHLEVGPSYWYGANQVTHSKYGWHLSGFFLDRMNWSFWLSVDSGNKTVSIVNPGAAVPTREGSDPLFLRFMAGTPLKTTSQHRAQSGHYRLFVGVVWLAADAAQMVTSSVPSAPTAGVLRTLKLKEWGVFEAYFAASLNPLGTVGVILHPETAFRLVIAKGIGIKAIVRAPFMRSIKEGSSAIFPSASIAAITRF